ncbi:MAG: peptidyl-prolyl cis-trans isomerase SurA [Arenicella sp.]|jgi:peptidyl-prolyl cis-trans isomerase SurA
MKSIKLNFPGLWLITALVSALSSGAVVGIAHAGFMDRVLVIVNEDVITQTEFDHRLSTVLGDIKKSGGTKPEGIEKQLLDGMVSDRLQIQEAKRRGITISDSELENALGRFGSKQGLDAQQLALQVESQGQSFQRFSESVRESLIISRLTEYYARTRVVVPDYEIDGFIAQNDMDDAGAEYQIAHILIKDPQANRELANQAMSELQSGLSFQEAVSKYSEATDAEQGGMIGWRSLDQLPDVFREAVKSVSVGGVTDLLESANGFHILKLIDLKGERDEIIQNEVRHILISSTTDVAKSQAAKKLTKIRQRIVSGEDFSGLARIYSDDSVSAATGGSLGWVSPGEMVPSFEETFKKLPIGEISQPVYTQYGVHIIEVLDRRKKNITDRVIRSKVDNILRRQRAEREFQQWIRELKEQAYIEHVSDPV